MRPALQRLLARPSSLEFLKLLVGTPTTNAARPENCVRGRRRASGLALKESRDWFEGWKDPNELERYATESLESPSIPTPRSTEALNPILRPSRDLSDTADIRRSRCANTPIHMLHQAHQPGFWQSKNYSRAELEHESNITKENPSLLINQDRSSLDVELWLFLLSYRKDKYGDAAVIMFWEAIFERGIGVPTLGASASALWCALLDTDFGKFPPGMLEDICQYADQIFEKYNQKWSKLYLQIMQYFLTTGPHEEAVQWHRTLEKYHAPGSSAFLELFYEVVRRQGNMAALMEIYTLNKHRKLYHKITKRICGASQRSTVIKWHFLLLDHGDLPTSLQAFEPISRHLRTYAPNSASRVIESLQNAGVSFLSEIPPELLHITPKTSRDLVSDVRSKTFHIAEKQYNDSLGARWFATSWVTLDTAIRTVHALGVQEIGPLSLQSIALRELETSAVLHRIEQLKSLGISIGASHYSLALKHFAMNDEQEYLDLLLQSDQHPSSFDDKKLQERLLAHFSQASDWKRFRLILKMLSFRSLRPAITKQNLLLRLSLHQSTPISFDAMRENILDLARSDVPLTPLTIRQVVACFLRPRVKGHKPNVFPGAAPMAELDQIISLLRQIVLNGSRVPILHWQDIIRRLGMQGESSALERLCLQIADWYGDDGVQSRLSQLPSGLIPPTQPQHPFRQLFSDSLQIAIVEWGFISALAQKQNPDSIGSEMLAGVKLLKKLASKKVYINRSAVRRALLNRLVTYYGKGESKKASNRVAKKKIKLSLTELAVLMDIELGAVVFSNGNAERMVEEAEAAVAKRKGRRFQQSRNGVGSLTQSRRGRASMCIRQD